MDDTVRHHTSFRIPVTDPVPPRLPEQEAGDYRWASNDWTEAAHAFPWTEAGRLPAPAICGVRWTVRFAHEGSGKCFECVALLRDQLRAVSVALAAAGVDLSL